MALHAKNLTAAELNNLVREHEKFISGETSEQKDGAVYRLAAVEDHFKDIRRSLNQIRVAVYGIVAAVIIYFLTQELPKWMAHIATTTEIPRIISFLVR